MLKIEIIIMILKIVPLNSIFVSSGLKNAKLYLKFPKWSCVVKLREVMFPELFSIKNFIVPVGN